MGLLLLVIAVSLDGFGVGITYGLRKVKVPLNALFVIMFCSGMIVFLSMAIGNILHSFISPQIAELLGGFIFICLGLIVLLQMFRSKLSKVTAEVRSEGKLHNLKTVLSTPDQADLDQSGSISINEAFLLGTALALDAFGAGMGAALLGYSPILTTILIALTSGLFLFSGLKVGLLMSNNKYMQQLSILPPLLLIALGLFNLF